MNATDHNFVVPYDDSNPVVIKYREEILDWSLLFLEESNSTGGYKLPCHSLILTRHWLPKLVGDFHS
jgi:hypothetical protein